MVHDQLVLNCPACQESADWTAELERCAKCRSAHLIRRLGQVECLDCGLVREPAAPLHPGPVPGLIPGLNTGRDAADTALADEVSRALDRLLGRT
ncbi:MAG TPA: hypothetical protein VN870_13585 [Streptosporangiaceae bacterium]|nr:hypothetical protein [Streptosporangiaceae bacterium]